MSKINLFDYTNYRDFLRDKYDELKNESSSFSYRYFSMKCGYSSPNFLKLVTEGKRNLSQESVKKFSHFFKFDKNEKIYFEKLVKLNQAKCTSERAETAKEILKSTLFNRVHPLAKDQFEYTSKWYYVAVRELLATENHPLGVKRISELIFPKVSETKIKRALEILIRLKMVKKINNRFVQTEEVVSTGDEVTYSGVADYHREMMRLASNSIDEISREHRDISGVAIGLSDEGIKELKQMIQAFRKDVLELSERDKKKRVVYQVSLQMFPLSKVEER